MGRGKIIKKGDKKKRAYATMKDDVIFLRWCHFYLPTRNISLLGEGDGADDLMPDANENGLPTIPSGKGDH